MNNHRALLVAIAVFTTTTLISSFILFQSKWSLITAAADQPLFNSEESVEDRPQLLLQTTLWWKLYREFMPVDVTRFARELPAGIFLNTTLDYTHPSNCSQLASHWNICNPPPCAVNKAIRSIQYPHKTAWGEDTGVFIDRVLREAWGPHPPGVDLYVRAGCGAASEIRLLWQSVELFWPRFLGKVIVVLDTPDTQVLDWLLPSKNQTHHFEVRVEPCPCMAGRIFNQFSYLTLEKYTTTAEYVVTIDSDCVFHSPVTPDLLFRDGRLLLPHSLKFQTRFWLAFVEFYTGPGTYKWHTMVTQPVPFHHSTFKAYRDWHEKAKGKCLENRITEMIQSHDSFTPFCWMCQLGVFLNSTGITASRYNFFDCDDPNTFPMMRFAIHVTYENNPFSGADFFGRTQAIVREGLCRAFGRLVFKEYCNGVGRQYVDLTSMTYTKEWSFSAAPKVKQQEAISNYLSRISNITSSLISDKQ